MSSFRVSNNKSKTNVAVVVAKPFCKHCDNLHLDTNHWLYSNGTLVCPVLKNTECTNCHKKGHTKSRCTRPASASAPVAKRTEMPQKLPASVVLRNKYAAFLEEEIEEEKRIEEHNKEFPALAPVSHTSVNTKASYSSVLTAPAPAQAPMPEPEKPIELTDYVKSLLSFKKRNWADYSDSDSDDEDGYFSK